MTRILIVDDESHIAQGIKFNLELDGYEVEVAEDGLRAKTLLFEEERPYDLIILDLMLPHVSGLDLCAAMRRKGNLTPVLMLTAKEQAQDKVTGLQVGADDYVTKPFNLDELLARVETILRRRSWDQARMVAEAPLIFGDARIDFAAHQAWVSESEVRLTPIELAIMKTFRDHEGRVISREKLLEAAWGWSGPATTRTVDNFIMRLRRVFEPDPAAPRHIVSVRGAGYKFLR